MIPVKFDCPNYEVLDRKKDLHLSVNLNMFDKNKLSLAVDAFNESNFKVEYDNHSFRLFVKDLYATVKKDNESEEYYFSISNDYSSTRTCLDNTFSEIRELLLDRKKDETISFYKWNKIWLSASEYDPKLGHSYHVTDLYTAVDDITCFEDPFLKTYNLNSFMIDSSILLCTKCDTSSLQA